jgi:uncharacterized membrane protein YccC
LTALSVYLAFCTYMLAGNTRQYFWYVSGFVCLVIAVGAGPTAESAFHTAVLRTQETGMGILVYSLIAVFLWPQSSGGELGKVAGRLIGTQRRLYQTSGRQFSATGTQEDAQALRMQQAQVLNQFAATLKGAEADTYEVWELRRQWRLFRQLSTSLGETLERWRESFPEIEKLDLQKLLPDVHAVCLEVDARLDQTERMLAGQAPNRNLEVVTVAINSTELRAFSHFQRAAIATFKTHLEQLEVLSQALVDCVADIKEHSGHSSLVPRATRAHRSLAPDPDRLLATLKVVATLWIAFLVWVYVDPPGHAGFVQFAATIAMAAAMLPQARPISMVLPFTFGCIFAGVLYVFVMPQLSSFWHLAIMIFGATFTIYYVFSEPRQALAKLGAIIPLLVLTSIQNEQTYDFARYANSTAMILLGLFLVVAVTYLPPSPRPEKAFLRLIKRFFRHAESLLSRLAPDRPQERGQTGHSIAAFYRDDLLDLPDKLTIYGRQIDRRISPEVSPEQIQAIINGARILAARLAMLEGAGEYPQSDLLAQELQDDIRAWRSTVQERFRLWARDPERAADESAADLRERLSARLDRLEARIGGAFTQAGEETLSVEDCTNFYRYLGSLRSVSEAGIEYVRLAGGVNWAHWKEARF